MTSIALLSTHSIMRLLFRLRLSIYVFQIFKYCFSDTQRVITLSMANAIELDNFSKADLICYEFRHEEAKTLRDSFI